MDAGGGNGTGVSWSSFSEDGSIRYGDEASPETVRAWVTYEGREVEVPVRNGHFLFVAWDPDYHDDPRVVRFE